MIYLLTLLIGEIYEITYDQFSLASFSSYAQKTILDDSTIFDIVSYNRSVIEVEVIKTILVPLNSDVVVFGKNNECKMNVVPSNKFLRKLSAGKILKSATPFVGRSNGLKYNGLEVENYKSIKRVFCYASKSELTLGEFKDQLREFLRITFFEKEETKAVEAVEID